MAVYVDCAGVLKNGRRWHHLTADSLEELHAIAARIGLRRSWFDRKAKYPHYDVTDLQREEAIRHGANAVSSKEIIRVARQLAGDRRSERAA